MVLCELELVIKRVKIPTTQDGSVMDLFFITDTRELLHANSRQEDAYNHLKAVLGDVMISCDIELVVKEMATSSLGNTFLPPDLAEEMFSLEMPKEPTSGHSDQANVSVIMDNYLSPAHTLIQIQCEDHKGLLYDIMRTLKDYNIQSRVLSYGIAGAVIFRLSLITCMKCIYPVESQKARKIEYLCLNCGGQNSLILPILFLS